MNRPGATGYAVFENQRFGLARREARRDAEYCDTPVSFLCEFAYDTRHHGRSTSLGKEG